MKETATRRSVDIGGTFTDVDLERNGTVLSAKVRTTYAAPELAIIDGMHEVCTKADTAPGDIDQIIHGTPLATNALIERRGANTALIPTEGSPVVIEMRTKSRFEQFDLNLTLPGPLLQRHMRFTVKGRIDAHGRELVQMDRSETEKLVDEIAAAGFESVAVGLVHSHLNPPHEEMVRDILLRKLPRVAVSLWSEDSPQMREYERFNTVVANACIKLLVASYLSRLDETLRTEGVRCRVFRMHCGGGIISISNAAVFPVRLVGSGPADGAVFAAHLADHYGLDRVISFDMSGTTAKICLIKNQSPKTARVFEVARSHEFKKGINCPLVNTKAYGRTALKGAIAPEIPNNAGSLAPFEVTAPENSFAHALHPALVALRHIAGHFVPDADFDAFDKIVPGLVPAESVGCLCNFQVSLRPRTDAPAPDHPRRSEVLNFNSLGSGARPDHDGLNVTAFASGVMTMPIEATEHLGPVIIWRKELRPDSGGAGKTRGNLGQYMEVGAQEGHEFDIQAMFDRGTHPARGRRGGCDGANTTIQQDEDTPMDVKGKQFGPHGRRVEMALPGGMGCGDPSERPRQLVKRDLAFGCLSAQAAARDDGLAASDIETILDFAHQGDSI